MFWQCPITVCASFNGQKISRLGHSFSFEAAASTVRLASMR
jgi:hypothetical protein